MRRSRTVGRYFVLLLLLLDDEPVELGVVELAPLELGLDVVVELLSVVVDVELELDGGGVVVVDDELLVDGVALGDADGVVRSRSVTRSVRLSVQAVSRLRPSAVAMTAVSSLFISVPPCGVARRQRKVQRPCRHVAA